MTATTKTSTWPPNPPISVGPKRAEAARACRICGCTEDNACQIDDGPCAWVEENLCSNPDCVAAVDTTHDPDAPTGPDAIRADSAKKDGAFIDEHHLQPGDEVLDDETIVRGQLTFDVPEREFRQIDVDDIAPSPTNRQAKNVDDLVPSIRELGVLQPVLVRATPDADKPYELIAGERRWRAAMTAGLERIPAMVGVDVVSDPVAFVEQLVENLQREGLDPLYEAQGYQQLLDTLNCTQRDLGDRLGISQSHISKRVQLLDLPDVARKKLDSGGITIHEALALTELKDHPKILVQVLKAGTNDLEWAVERALQGIDAERERAALLVKLEADGTKILTLKNDYDVPKGAKRLGGYSGLQVDAKKHAKESCHAVTLPRHGDPASWCTDPKRHAAKGGSELKLPKGATTRSSGPVKTPAQKKREAAERDAKEQRRAFMGELVTKRKMRQGDALQLIAHRYLDDANTDEHQKICELIGLEVTKPKQQYQRPDFDGAIDKWIAGSTDKLLRACLAFALVQGEWGYGHRDETYALLLDAGYQPHPAEKAEFTKAAKKR